MNFPFVRRFRLSPPGKGWGISCDAEGAFVGPVPLLKRCQVNGRETWEARDSNDLSDALAEYYGLPIDVSSKAQALASIARALNEGAVARAQLGTLHLQFPDPPPLAKGSSRGDLIEFIRELAGSGFLKANWDPAKHPRWSAGTPGSRGGKFAPKGIEPGEPGIGHNKGPVLEPEEAPAAETEEAVGLGPVAALAGAILLATTVPAGSADEDAAMEQFHRHHPWPKYLGGPVEQILERLPKWLHDEYHRRIDRTFSRFDGKEAFENLPPSEKKMIFQKMLQLTKDFDTAFGTKLYDGMLRNNFPGAR